jgi:hypothetical protein
LEETATSTAAPPAAAPNPQGNVVLDEHIEEDWEPCFEEVQEYAVWLGMDKETDRDLFYIAKEGLKAPLPPPWKPCKTSEGEIFYFNFSTGESAWDHPCDDFYRKQYEEAKAARAAAQPSAVRTPRRTKKKKEKTQPLATTGMESAAHRVPPHGSLPPLSTGGLRGLPPLEILERGGFRELAAPRRQGVS